MIRVALLPVFLLVGSALLPAQKKGNTDIQKAGKEDPFTEKDPKAMAKLGVVDYAPLIWADNKRTTDIDKVLGEDRVLWMETEHFKIGCNLGRVAAPQESKARKLLKQEMKRLNKKCKKFPASKSKLSPWVRMHLYAQRADDLYAEFAEFSGKNEKGKHLGQDNKFLVLLFQKKSDLARYLDRFCGKRSEQSQRHVHYGTRHYSVVLTAEGDDGPREPATVNAQFRWLLMQMLIDAAGGAPQWLSYGLAHHYEREVPCNMINCGVRADESVDPATQYDWERKMKKRCQHEALCIPFVELCKTSDFGYYAHVQSWSRVDYLMQDRAKFAEFVQSVLKNYGRARQISALAAVYEMAPEDFDAEWRKWALKYYK